jgi:phosphoribosylformylglycinamidine synthase I
MKAAVIVFPGSNCDRDVAVALAASAGRAPAMVWHGEASLPKLDLIVVPGGFSYGDYLRSGAMAAHSPVMREVVAHANRGVPVLAICNGFQILTECGLLPGALMRNAGLRFVCRDVHVRVENAFTPFSHQYDDDQVIRIPIAHHDGNYFADDDTLAALLDNDQVAFRYCQPWGEADESANPNGSADNIAGIFNRQKTVLGMMPHPERLADPALGGDDGRGVFESLVAALS